MTKHLASLLCLAVVASSTTSAYPTSQQGAGVASELWARAASSITTSAQTASSRSYDYVIVGAGLAGMTLANRLSDGNASVIVIEAGADTRENTQYVKTVDKYSAAFGNPDFDWAWNTMPNDIDGSTKTIHGGKGLGGSTSINGAAWTKGAKEQYDGIGSLGNSGWGFDDLQHYMTLAENFTTPDSNARVHSANFDVAAHGFSGPVQTWFTDSGSGSSKRDVSKRMYTGPGPQAFIDAQKSALGVEHVADLGSGSPNGVAMTPNTINPAGGDSQLRVSSATAYLTPIEFSRPNLVVLTTYRTTQINWASSSGSPAKASGVTISKTKGGQTYVIKANKEVIVSAGAINSPILLEASGVGNTKTLKRIGVAQRIALPGVGLNLAEQTMNTVGSKANVDYSGGGPSSTIAFPSVKQLFPSNWTAVEQYIENNMASWAQDAVNNGAAVSVDGLMTQYKVAVSNIFDSDAPIAEHFFDVGYPSNSYGIDVWQLLPFSRGYVHAGSASVFDAPRVQPRYFSAPIDMDIQVAALRGARKVLMQDSLNSLTYNGETTPGFDTIPNGTNLGLYRRWRDWILQGYASVAHPIGTCAMTPQSAGGVVDNQFRLYGASNVRIVDASVLPMQVSAHLSSTLYGIAEKAAATIKGSS